MHDVIKEIYFVAVLTIVAVIHVAACALQATFSG